MDTQKKNEIDEAFSSIDNAKNFDEAYSHYVRAITLLNTVYYSNLRRHYAMGIHPNFSKIGGQSTKDEFSNWVTLNRVVGDVSQPYVPLPIQHQGSYAMATTIPFNFEDQITALNLKISELSNHVTQIEAIKKDILYLQKENQILKETGYSLATESSSPYKIQFIPVEIYLDVNDPELCFKVYTSVLDFLKSVEFERAFEFEAIKGSWFKRIMAKSQKSLTSDQVTNRLKEVEYGIEVNTILKPQSEVDKNQSEALLNILTSVDKIPNAAIRIGTLLVVKITNSEGSVNVQVRTLSIKELHLLNKKPELLRNPQQVLIALTQEIDNGERDGQDT